MNTQSLKLALDILLAGGGLAVASLTLPKITSDLGLNRVLRRKHMAEQIQALFIRPEYGTAPTPMVIQAQFHAAFDCETPRIPSGKDLLHFLENASLATFQNAQSLAVCLAFVTYSKLAGGFIPSGRWTAKKLRREFIYQGIAYGVGFVATMVLFLDPVFGPNRAWLAFAAAIYTFFKAYRGGLISRAQGLLKLTPLAGQ